MSTPKERVRDRLIESLEFNLSYLRDERLDTYATTGDKADIFAFERVIDYYNKKLKKIKKDSPEKDRCEECTVCGVINRCVYEDMPCQRY